MTAALNEIAAQQAAAVNTAKQSSGASSTGNDAAAQKLATEAIQQSTQTVENMKQAAQVTNKPFKHFYVTRHQHV